MSQTILNATDNYKELDEYFTSNSYNRVFLVCGSSIKFLRLDNYFAGLNERLGIRVTRFSDFKPNPLYESIVSGVDLFLHSNCDIIVAVGGGSALDVAKCIKLFSNMDCNRNFLTQKIVSNKVPFLAIPTTAGTGSEATRYAVIYYEGEKQSITDYSCIPSTVLFDSSCLESLPEYQKKATMLDALCHSIESFWSVNSTYESKRYSSEAIKMIFDNLDSYLANEETGNTKMLEASNLAGKAINITQTTAGHAMCYKLTSLYKISHGHAAALCVNALWPFMSSNINKCIDPRGKEYLESTFTDIANAMNCASTKEAQEKFTNLLARLNFNKIENIDEKDFDLLKKSVNPIRLKNNPVGLTEENINVLYHEILGR